MVEPPPLPTLFRLLIHWLPRTQQLPYPLPPPPHKHTHTKTNTNAGLINFTSDDLKVVKGKMWAKVDIEEVRRISGMWVCGTCMLGGGARCGQRSTLRRCGAYLQLCGRKRSPLKPPHLPTSATHPGAALWRCHGYR
eukprot:358082-Chlamydomonas_euryale.AAC.1